MAQSTLLKFATILSFGGVALAVGCMVDSSKYVFDDDEFDELNTGGRSQGGETGSGGEGGDSNGNGVGGKPSSGGMGGDLGSAGGNSSVTCQASSLRCRGKQLEVCTGSDWLAAGDPCEFVCENNACTGVCEPNTTECVNEKEQGTCNSSGQWDVAFCEHACVEKSCGGVCSPGTFQCGTEQDGRIPIESCTAEGAWSGTTTICNSGCAEGICTGGCEEGRTQCGTVAGAPVVLTCPRDGADWRDAIVTPCVHQACVDGVCQGVCTPSSKECSGQTRWVCGSNGEWTTQRCDYVCTPEACIGGCMPRSTRCDGDKVLVCNDLGQWTQQIDCSREKLTCIELEKDAHTCGECNRAQLEDRQVCNFNRAVVCGKDGLWGVQQDCSVGGGLCFAGAGCSSSCITGSVGGCFKSSVGWYCESRGQKPIECECDCSNGSSCANTCK